MARKCRKKSVQLFLQNKRKEKIFKQSTQTACFNFTLFLSQKGKSKSPSFDLHIIVLCSQWITSHEHLTHLLSFCLFLVPGTSRNTDQAGFSALKRSAGSTWKTAPRSWTRASTLGWSKTPLFPTSWRWSLRNRASTPCRSCIATEPCPSATSSETLCPRGIKKTKKLRWRNTWS